MSDESITSRLNEYLVKMYQRRIIRELYNDPTLPWLPESYWREDFERRVQDNTTKILDLAEHALMRAKVRRSEDEWLADNASVEELLEEGIEPLLHNGDPRLERSNWGRMLMKHSGGSLRPPTDGDPQPAYHFQCYQCGRPVTDDGYDHGHSTRCDHALMDACDAYPDHQLKPWHGEEEDDEDEE